MKYYLIALLFIIMAAGGRAMFEAAYHGMATEHEFAPNAATSFFMYFSIWFVFMMIADIILLRNKTLRGRNVFIAFLSVGVFVPVIYMIANR